MNVWIFQTGEPLHCDTDHRRPMRAMNLANALVNSGHTVTIWSSAFFHQEKRHRSKAYSIINISNSLEIRLVPSPGYLRNIGLARLFDHAVLAFNLRKLLSSEKLRPDAAVIGYPPIEFSFIAQKWLSKRGVPTILDVKDLWPEIFVDALPDHFKLFGRLILFPYFFIAKKVINNVTAVSSMSHAFIDNILTSFGRPRNELDVPFPFAVSKIDVTKSQILLARRWWEDIRLGKKTIFRVCYVGNISPALDLSPIKDAALHYAKKNICVEFVICGDGISFSQFKNEFDGVNNVKFVGGVNHAQAIALAEVSNVSLIPYKNSKDFQLSLPNKFVDSLSYGLPILCPLEGEVAKMISEFRVGMSYGTPFKADLVDVMDTLINNEDLQLLLRQNAKQTYLKFFTFDNVYSNFVNHIKRLV